jgi:hypothetical protein
MGILFSYQAIYIMSAVILSWLVAHLLKPFCNKSVSWKQVFTTDGGMPSAHTAPAAALSFAIFFSEGFTVLFVLSLVFLVALMRDAVGVRFAVGKNALALKELVGKKKLKNKIFLGQGHLPKEVMASLFLGIFVALLLFLVF